MVPYMLMRQEVLKAQNPKGEVVNTVGSGDSTVAGMVAVLSRDSHLKKHFAKQ